MVGWHHWCNAHRFERAPIPGDGQGSLQSMGSQRVRHNWVTELNWLITDLCPWLLWLQMSWWLKLFYTHLYIPLHSGWHKVWVLGKKIIYCKHSFIGKELGFFNRYQYFIIHLYSWNTYCILSIVQLFISLELGTKLPLMENNENSNDFLIIQQYWVLHISEKFHQKSPQHYGNYPLI